MDNRFRQPRRPVGLYRPEFEHDSCGVGFVAHIKGQYSHSIIDDAYTVLRSMDKLADRALTVLNNNYPDHDSLDEDGNFRKTKSIKEADRGWLNRITFGLIG